VAAFLCIYIQEAHPDDGWQVLTNLKQEVVYRQHRSLEERAEVAGVCMRALDLEMPVALDEMSDEVDLAYAALPERLYVIDREGRIAWRSEPGPWGFDVDAWDVALKAQRGA
jgi:hypothetical protein